jgi:predicted TIM-barrel fold metal-dependent hydrolase
MKYVLALSLVIIILSCSNEIDFYSFPKTDAHVHLYTESDAFVQLAQDHNFKLFTITTRSDSREKIDQRLKWAMQHQKASSQTVAYTTTFSMDEFGQPGWLEQTLTHLQNDFDNGAVGVKVWKDIGMTFRNPDSSFIMIDDPRLDPVFDYIAEQGKILVAHIGEPKNCWLPLDSMTTNNDRSYFKDHPEYHMYLHPEYPSYEDQINARDHVLAKHPKLRMVGCHLGSLEWDVDELAKRLDQFPNFAVDTAARHGQLQVQNRDKVRQFFIDYQDRILYGTDIIASGDVSKDQLSWMLDTWHADWDYFATDQKLTSDKVNNEFTGLKLPPSVLKKIYFENAKNWLGF